MKRTLTIELPWPNRALSPNSRVDPFSKARIFKSTKMQAFLATKIALKGLRVVLAPGTHMNLRLIPTPPVLRYRDEDNLIANCKSYFDGIAEAFKIDDHLFHLREQLWHPDEKPGKLIIEADWEDPTNDAA